MGTSAGDLAVGQGLLELGIPPRHQRLPEAKGDERQGAARPCRELLDLVALLYFVTGPAILTPHVEWKYSQHYALFCLNIFRRVSAAIPFVPDMTEQFERIHEETSISALQEPFALPTGQDVVLDEVIAEVVQFGNPVLVRSWNVAPKSNESITHLSGIA